MFIRIVLVAVGLLGLSSTAWSQTPLFALEGRTSYVFSSSDHVRGESLKIRDGIGYGFGITYGFRDQSLEATVDASTVKIEDGVLNGDLLMIPILFSGYLRFHPVGRRWFPTLGAGFGSVILDFDPDQKAPGQKFEFTDTIAWQVVAGFEYFVIRKLTLSFHVRYLFSRGFVRIEEVVGGESVARNHRVRLDKVATGIGFKKYF